MDNTAEDRRVAEENSKQMAENLAKVKEARTKALDEQRAEIDKRNAEKMEWQAKAKPTPTQREADLAKLGALNEFDEKEDDGSGTEEEYRARALEPGPKDPITAGYETREVGEQRRGPGRPRKDESKAGCRRRSRKHCGGAAKPESISPGELFAPTQYAGRWHRLDRHLAARSGRSPPSSLDHFPDCSMGLLQRVADFVVGKAAEGEPRDGPYWLPITGGFLSHEAGQFWNWWQMGHDVVDVQPNAMVEACISAYAQTIAMLPGDHWSRNQRNGLDRVSTSAASRVVRKPNDYQSASDFLLNAVRDLLLTGNAYALALRNDRFEISELHLMLPRASGARQAVSGDIFYNLGGNPIIEARLGADAHKYLAAVPARDVLHMRVATPRDRLVGISPLTAVISELAQSGAMTMQQVAYYQNQARPSAVYSTDQRLIKQQADEIREIIASQGRGANAGGILVLANGVKPHTTSNTNEQSQYVEGMTKLDEHIALALGVPMQVLGVGTSAPFASTEALMNYWLARGLGFYLNHVELAFDNLFRLPGQPKEFIAFDTRALLRSAEQDRITASATAIKGGIKTINEVRQDEGLDGVTGGDEIRIQMQDVTLTQQAEAQEAANRPPPPPPTPAAPPDGADEADDEEPDDERSSTDWTRAILDAANKYDRRDVA